MMFFSAGALYTVQDNIPRCGSLCGYCCAFFPVFMSDHRFFRMRASVIRQGMLAIPDVYTLFRHGAVTLLLFYAPFLLEINLDLMLIGRKSFELQVRQRRAETINREEQAN